MSECPPLISVANLHKTFRLNICLLENKNLWVMVICVLIPLTSHDWAEIDHIRLLFFQITVENLKRGPHGFKFFVYFVTFLMSSDLRINHSTVLWIRGVHSVVPRLFWFVTKTQNHITLKTGWTPLSFFNCNLEKQQP